MDSVIQKERRTAEKPKILLTSGESSNGSGYLESQPIEGKGSSFMMLHNASSSKKSKPINEGFAIWEKQRNAWRNLSNNNNNNTNSSKGEGETNKKLSSAFSITKRKRGQRSAIPHDATYEDLLLIPFVKFPKPIKLGEMIDFLVETWSEENNFW